MNHIFTHFCHFLRTMRHHNQSLMSLCWEILVIEITKILHKELVLTGQLVPVRYSVGGVLLGRHVLGSESNAVQHGVNNSSLPSCHFLSSCCPLFSFMHMTVNLHFHIYSLRGFFLKPSHTAKKSVLLIIPLIYIKSILCTPVAGELLNNKTLKNKKTDKPKKGLHGARKMRSYREDRLGLPLLLQLV